MGAVNRAALAQATGPMTEKQFQALVLEVARLTGWRAYHTHNSRRSHKGFPDLTLVRPPRIVFAELKSETGKLRPEQKEWLEALTGCPGVEAYLWRPADLGDIGKILSTKQKETPGFPQQGGPGPATPRDTTQSSTTQ